MFNDSSDKSFMVRQISRVAQTIICPFPFEHEACLDSTEKQIGNAMRARTQEFKKPRSRSNQPANNLKPATPREETLSKGPLADRRFLNSRVLSAYGRSETAGRRIGAVGLRSRATGVAR